VNGTVECGCGLGWLLAAFHPFLRSKGRGERGKRGPRPEKIGLRTRKISIQAFKSSGPRIACEIVRGDLYDDLGGGRRKSRAKWEREKKLESKRAAEKKQQADGGRKS
jgi:hypothetical protein